MRRASGTIENCKFSISNLKLPERAPIYSLSRSHTLTLSRLLTVLFLLASPLALPAASPNAEFEQANKLYEEGKFKQAAAAYQSLIDRGAELPTIYYNLGNAWYKAGQNGRAVAAYLHAERNGGAGKRSITSRVRIEEAELERRQRRDFLLLRNHHLLKGLRSGQTEWICGLDVAVRSVDFEIAPGRLRGQVQ